VVKVCLLSRSLETGCSASRSGTVRGQSAVVRVDIVFFEAR